MHQSSIGRYSGIDLTDAGNTWFIPHKTIQDKSERPHPTTFPIELPLKCIKLHGLAMKDNFVVLDPFCGIGSTAIACKRLWHTFCWFRYGGTISGCSDNESYERIGIEI